MMALTKLPIRSILIATLACPSLSVAAPVAARITRALQEYFLQLLLAGVLAIVLVGTWLYLRGHRRTFVALVVAALATSLGLGWFVLNQRYPNQALFDGGHWRDGLAIVLGKDIRLSKYQPEPLLKVPRETVARAAYPAIDAHFHLESLPPDITAERLVAAMDAAGIAKVAHMGSLPNNLEAYVRKFKDPFPDRFIMFARPDFPAALRRDDGVQRQVEWIEVAARLGARGLKIQKSLGTSVKDASGRLVGVDDPRFDPIWEKAGELGLPVLIHTSDPTAFFIRPDEHNERLEEMLERPDWVNYGKDEPSKEELIAQRNRLVARHPGTNFIGAHMGSSEDDLSQVAELLDRYPNYYVDMASVVHALGRQPVTARAFFIRYQDRILFGTDGGYALQSDGAGWTPERYFRNYIEFLETSNEHVEYPLWGINKQGRWRVYGLDLPAEVLEKIYLRNAERLIPSDQAMSERLAGRFPSLESGSPILPGTP
jgi:predicted TIM-barrel fold metal-dependent hydrolase